jgi:hypothetical protein
VRIVGILIYTTPVAMGSCLGIMDNEEYQKFLQKYDTVESIFKRRVISQQQNIHQIIDGKRKEDLSEFERRQLAVLDSSIRLTHSLYSATFKQRTQLHDIRIMAVTKSLLQEINTAQESAMKNLMSGELTRLLDGLRRVDENQGEVIKAIRAISETTVSDTDIDKIIVRYQTADPNQLPKVDTLPVTSTKTVGDDDDGGFDDNTSLIPDKSSSSSSLTATTARSNSVKMVELETTTVPTSSSSSSSASLLVREPAVLSSSNMSMPSSSSSTEKSQVQSDSSAVRRRQVQTAYEFDSNTSTVIRNGRNVEFDKQ